METIEKTFEDPETGREKKIVLTRQIINHKEGYIRNEYETHVKDIKGEGFTVAPASNSLWVVPITKESDVTNAVKDAKAKIEAVTDYDKRLEVLK